MSLQISQKNKMHLIFRGKRVNKAKEDRQNPLNRKMGAKLSYKKLKKEMKEEYHMMLVN